jgi:transcriptional regulator with XRE-family HTH domain
MPKIRPKETETIGGRIAAARQLVPKRNQPEFAQLFGVTRQAVSNWERNVGIKTEKLLQIAEKTGVSLEWLVNGRGTMVGEKGDRATPAQPALEVVGAGTVAASAFSTTETLAIYATTDFGEIMVISNTAIQHIAKPDILAGIPGSYGIMVSSNSNTPAYEIGDTICLHPLLPYVIGSDVLLIGTDENRKCKAMIGRLMDISPTTWTIKQFGTGRQSVIDRAVFAECHKIVARYPR